MKRYFDIHIHCTTNSDYGKFADVCRKHNMQVAISSLPVGYQNFVGDEGVEEAMQAAPDVYIGCACVLPGDSLSASLVDQFYEKGFRGFKVILPQKPYGDPAYFPFYKRAEELGMPCLFHTGIVHLPPEGFRHGVSADYMMPLALDSLACSFPKLNIIMAHTAVGVQAEPAQDMMRCRANVYGDISGGHHDQKRKFENIKRIGQQLGSNRDIRIDKMVMGSDYCTDEPGKIEKRIKLHEEFLDCCQAEEEKREGYLWKTASSFFKK